MKEEHSHNATELFVEFYRSKSHKNLPLKYLPHVATITILKREKNYKCFQYRELYTEENLNFNSPSPQFSPTLRENVLHAENSVSQKLQKKSCSKRGFNERFLDVKIIDSQHF